MNMASTGFSLMLLIFSINLASASPKFIGIKCEVNQVAEFGQDALLKCDVIPTPEAKDLKIYSVKWTRYPRHVYGPVEVLKFFHGKTTSNDGYSLAEPQWSNTNKNVSLLISKAAVQHDGNYQCEVETNCGDDKSDYISFQVTAKYTEPTIEVIEKRSRNEYEVLECKSTGYPEGQLCWFDQDGYNWTSSASVESKKMNDGRIELTSRMRLLEGSKFNFECAVFDAAGNKVHQVSLPETGEVKDTQPSPKPTSESPSPAVIAPLVVIGSLIVALLLVVIYKLHSKKRHHQRPISQSDVEEGDNEQSALEPK